MSSNVERDIRDFDNCEANFTMHSIPKSPFGVIGQFMNVDQPTRRERHQMPCKEAAIFLNTVALDNQVIHKVDLRLTADGRKYNNVHNDGPGHAAAKVEAFRRGVPLDKQTT